MRRSTAKILSVISMILTVVLCFMFIPSGNTTAMIIIFIVYIPIAIVLNYFQRCRHCGRWPQRGDFRNEYCPGCGKPLDDE